MRMTGSTFAPGRQDGQPPLSIKESLQIYFTILFAVAVFVTAFYYLFPV